MIENLKCGFKTERYILSDRKHSGGGFYFLFHFHPLAHLIIQDCHWSIRHHVPSPGSKGRKGRGDSSQGIIASTQPSWVFTLPSIYPEFSLLAILASRKATKIIFILDSDVPRHKLLRNYLENYKERRLEWKLSSTQ